MQVESLTKKYGDKEILSGVHLTIKSGEVFGFIGHNGAGKSTFIHTLAGIIKKSAGSFKIAGITDEKIDKIKKHIGVMPDISNLYEHMTGLQFLRYMGALTKDTRSKDEYEALLKSVGLEGEGDKKIKTYSFGMKKKICIAQALLGNPDLIILDEPTSGIDPESAIRIRNLIIQLQKKKKTIILTSHNLEEIDKISDRVGILSGGIIKKIGTPRQLKEELRDGTVISIRTKPKLSRNDISRLISKLEIDISFINASESHTQLKMTSDEDIPVLTRAVIEENIELYELKVEERSLEDVFMNT